jgi:predicted nucleotidyltransferase
MIDSALIDRVTRTIVERFNPKRIVLFGSHARGDADPESDLDLFIEMESTKKPPERDIEVDEVFGLRDWPMDLFVYTPEEVERFRGVIGTLVSIVEAEGKVLYERP